MQIGLIGGIGPAATDFYYRNLIEKFASKKKNLDMTIVHADAPTLIKNLMEDNKDRQVTIYNDLTLRLKKAGANSVAITSIAGHFCIDKFKEKSVLPVVDLLYCVQKEIKNKGYSRIGILGTKPVMISRFYSMITSAEVFIPEGILLDKVHEAYAGMATLGRANKKQKEIFENAINQFLSKNKVDAVMLGGTDLALIYQSENVDFELIDCIKIHTEELFRFNFN